MDKNYGLIHIYCGDGKGKTTASLGLALRCSGCGHKVLVAQFLKGSNTSELEALKEISKITVLRSCDKIPFTINMTEEDKLRVTDIHNQLFSKIKETVYSEDICLLVLDEIIATVNCGLIDKQMVYDFLDNKPEHLEVVLTGRDPSDELCKRASYISEIKKIKHPFDAGIKARKGIEK